MRSAWQRRAELVGGVGAERALARDQLVEPPRRGVERDADLVDLGDAGARCADGEVAVTEPAGRAARRSSGPRETPAEQQRRADGHDDDRGREPGKRQPAGVGVVRGGVVGALGAHGTDHALAGEQRHGDDEPAVSGGVGRAPCAQRGAHDRRSELPARVPATRRPARS